MSPHRRIDRAEAPGIAARLLGFVQLGIRGRQQRDRLVGAFA